MGESVQGYNLFTYCFNNPVNLSDETGHWPQWLKDIGNAVATSFVNFGKAVWATVQSFTTEIGVGIGFKGALETKVSNNITVSGNAGFKNDMVNIQIGTGTADIGSKTSSSFSGSIGPINVGTENGVFHTYVPHDNCPTPNLVNTIYSIDELKKCPATKVLNEKPKASLGVGFEAYFIIGVTFNVGFDYKYWIDELIKIYSE